MKKKGPRPRPELERFWEKIQITDNGCWMWQAYVKPNGYAGFGIGNTEENNRKMEYAHRWAYRNFIGEIPKGLELDHLCRNRSCVNPNHLEPVTRKENLSRSPLHALNQRSKTHCPSGHPYDEHNTYKIVSKNRSHRLCRECRRIRNREDGRKVRLKLKKEELK